MLGFTGNYALRTTTATLMIDYERGLYVRIQELSKGPPPYPSDHGFDANTAYRVLGIYNPSESGECWLIMSNNSDELWYISQRHVRTLAQRADIRTLREPVELFGAARAP